MPHIDPEAPDADQPVEVGQFTVPCEGCEEPIPVAVVAWIETEEDGTQNTWTEPDLTDYAAHLLTHDRAELDGEP